MVYFVFPWGGSIFCLFIVKQMLQLVQPPSLHFYAFMCASRESNRDAEFPEDVPKSSWEIGWFCPCWFPSNLQKTRHVLELAKILLFDHIRKNRPNPSNMS